MVARILLVSAFCSVMLPIPDGALEAYGGEPRLVRTSADGVEIEVDGLDYQLQTVHLEGVAYTRVLLPGGMWLPEPGRPAVPVRGTLLGVPFGARVAVTVAEAEFDEISGVLLLPAPHSRPTGRGAFGAEVEVYEPDAEVYATDALYPAQQAVVTRTGVMRDQRVAGISLRPIQYNPARQQLLVARRLRVRVRFLRDERSIGVSPSDEGVGGGFEECYENTLLNADQARPWRGRTGRGDGLRKPRISENLDPAADYYKIRIRDDGLYRLDAAWFSDAGIALQAGDMERLKVFVNGREVPLDVRDDGDGVPGEGEGAIFYGEYRRAPDRNFEHELGREQVYWLTLDGRPGRRFEEIDGSPGSRYPPVALFAHTAHAEVDSLYDPLGDAPDANRDHWYWGRTGSPGRPGTGLQNVGEYPVTVPVALPGLDRTRGATARIRVGMHGLTFRRRFEPDHRTVVRLSGGTVVADDRWDGKRAFVAEGTVPVSELDDTTRVTLATPGAADFPADYIEHVFLNWVEVAYSRRLECVDGKLAFTPDETGDGRTFSISGFRDADVSVYDVAAARRIRNIEVTPGDAGFRARFELPAVSGRFVAMDSEAIQRAPAGEAARVPVFGQAGADYVIVVQPRFREAAEQLADHRRGRGLRARVVDVTEIYDAFSFGQFEPRAIRRFVRYAFENWTRRPTYLLLFGADSFDYRRNFDDSVVERHVAASVVPSLPFQSVRRGLTYTDHFFGAVSGPEDDLFQDVFVGRLPAATRRGAAALVRKIVAYDRAPHDRWRDRALFMANYDPLSIFTSPSDRLSANYTEPLGLESFKVYNDEDIGPEPNADTGEVIRQINEGRLLVNFLGHGSVSGMARFLRGSSQRESYNYMRQIVNADRLPIVVALSCLNGQFSDPRFTCLAEEMTGKADGGAIAYISASALAAVITNDFLNDRLFGAFFKDGVREFGAGLGIAKAALDTRFPELRTLTLGIHLIGDPAQELAILPNPDFALDSGSLRVERVTGLTVEDSVRVAIRIENAGITPRTGPAVVLVDRNLDRGVADTLFSGVFPAFGHRDSTAVTWPLAGRAGRHLLSLAVDPDDEIPELDESNNYVEVELDVSGTLSAVPTMPRQSQVVPASAVRLAVRPGADAQEVYAEFEVGGLPAFDGPGVIRSGPVAGREGLVLWKMPEPAPGTYYWRTRVREGDEYGAWSAVMEFTAQPAAPPREILWRQDADGVFRWAEGTDVRLAEGAVSRVVDPPPLRLNADAREEAFAAEGVRGTGVLCSDGAYLYVNRFYSPTAVYPGTDIFERIGTGFRGTRAGQNHGVLADTPVLGVSATYHSDGFIYADNRRGRELARISPSTGAVDRVQVPDGLMEFRTGLVFDGHSLITSDGAYIYNLAAAVDGVQRAGWSVRVFDPSNGWRLEREFTVAPTETGFAYLVTDGVIADGRYLYLVEFGTGLTHRVRVVDARNGEFIEEYESDQAETDILTGQYDWINNKVWMGQLNGPMIYRYAGKTLPPYGTLTSEPIGPAGAWLTLALDVRKPPGGRAEVDILGASPSGGFAPLAEWTGLDADDEIDLGDLREDRIRVRVRLFGEELGSSAGLAGWNVRYRPQSDLVLSGLKAAPLEVDELEPVRLAVQVRNAGPLDLVPGAVVAFFSGAPENGRLIGRASVPEETPLGETTTVSLVWNTARFAGANVVTARLEDLSGRPSHYARETTAGETVEVHPSDDRTGPELDLVALDAAGEVRPDDFLPSTPKFSAVFRDSSGIDAGSVRIVLAGPGDEISDVLTSDRVSDRKEDGTSLEFTWSPRLDDGRYTLSVSGTDQLGNGPAEKSMAFQVSSDLAIKRVLNVPNPTAEATEFTYILSRPAEVEIRIFTISGRLIRILEGAPGRAGYNQIRWDGRDAGGHLLANGVYLYTVTANDGRKRVREKERLIVYR
ncbi:MAG: C25 family cysteine peptidase [Gemmatimonadota bacterium]|nr:C25 family cysteine peptidase [Gemmatimonadota bacterium]